MYIHVVKKGENIYSIGHSVGVGADEIALVNGLVSEHPLPGSSLLIPTQVPTMLHTYTVQAGDTLRKVAGRFHIPEKLAQAANPAMNAEELPVGRMLTMPVPLAEKQAIEVNMRLEIQGDAEEMLTIREARDCLTNLSVASAWIERDGTISVPEETERVQPAVAREAQAKRLLLITPIDEEAAQRVMQVPACRRAFFTDLRRWIDFDEFAGVHLECTLLPSDLRLAFNGFVRELATRVHQKRGEVFVAVPSHHEGNAEHPRYGAFDLPWLARYVDRIVWNTEESYGRPDGPPMAVAPRHLIKRSLAYLLQHVPKQKVLLGLPLYGFDWPRPFDPDRLARMSIDGPPSEEEEMVEAPKQVHWDDRAMTPMFTYRDETGELREVWYEDVRSLGAKLQLVHDLRLAGVSCLVAGSAAPGSWQLLYDMFEIRRSG
ncbi:MAG: LysM peptidoglycan-binding domain-containing protein [Tumebacillaceae bacterium]